MAALAILLPVLKIIGIIVLVIVCIAAALLLIPIRYFIEGETEGGRIAVRVSWLLNALHFRFLYLHSPPDVLPGREGEPQMKSVLRIFFYKIDFLDEKRKEKRQAARACRREKKRKKSLLKAQKKHCRKGKAGAKQRKTTEQRRSAEHEFKENQWDAEYQRQYKDGEDPKDSPGKESDNASGIAAMAGRAGAAVGMIKKMREKKTFSLLWPPILTFLIRIRPRRIRGEAAFGFEDPSLTGRVLGGLAAIPLFYRNGVEISPDFESDHAYLDGKIDLRGRIHMLHVLILAVQLGRKKEIRAFLREARRGAA